MDVRSKWATVPFVVLAITSLARALALEGHFYSLVVGLTLWVIGLMLLTLLLAWVSRRFVVRPSPPTVIRFVRRETKSAAASRAA